MSEPDTPTGRWLRAVDGTLEPGGSRSDEDPDLADDPHGPDDPDAASDGSVGRLLELSVGGLALLERLQLSFEPGLNVITGETGAGKTLLIDALGLALGSRADTSLVRHGSDAARVEVLFDRVPEPLICVREVTTGGRSTARIDDEAVTAARLAASVGPLIEIHGQHDQQRLLDARWQRDLLDAFGGHAAARAAVAAAVARWRDNRISLTELSIEPRELARRIELLDHEASEIASARLRDGEAEEIRTTLATAQHAEAISRGGSAIRDALLGEGSGARDATAGALTAARTIARHDARWDVVVQRLEALEAELADVASSVRDLADSVDHDPAELARLEERLSLIYGLERRYGDDEAAVIRHGESARAEADRLRGIDEEVAARRAEDARLLEAIATASATLSERRHAAALELADAVSRAVEPLGFPASSFDVGLGRRVADADEAAVEIDGDAVAFDATGVDQVVFRFAPNPGEPARPLARIASGGELSRVALGIKEVLAELDLTPTLVFDEIDTGIGGRSAEPVGRSLWALGRSHEVLCVTHLPQIAAYADAHFQIVKRERDGRTVTEVRALDREGRIVELAAMLGGSGGPAALASARELLDRAEGWRGEFLAAAG